MNRFESNLAEHKLTLRWGQLQTSQIHVGRKCNQACHHCHVDARFVENVSEDVGKSWCPVLNQISVAVEGVVHSVCRVPSDLFQPSSVRFLDNSGELHFSRRQSDDEQHMVAEQLVQLNALFQESRAGLS
jgi:hypothetical protein